MIVLIALVSLLVWTVYVYATHKGMMKPIAIRNDWIKLLGGLYLFLVMGVLFIATQSFCHQEVGNSYIDYRRGRLISSDSSTEVGIYVQTKWFGFIEEGRWFAKEIPEEEQISDEGSATWKYRDSDGKWHDVPGCVTSPEAYADDREYEPTPRGWHEIR